MNSNTETGSLVYSLDDKQWDEFVEGHPDGWIYHLSSWKRVLEASFRHIKGLHCAIIDRKGDRISAGLPLYIINSWLTGKRMVSMPFSTLATPLINADDQLMPLFSAARALCDRHHCTRLEIRSMRSYPGSAAAGFFATSRFKHHALDITQPVETLFKRLDRSCVRQRIARAETSKISVRKGDSQADLRAFFDLYALTRRRVGRPAQPFGFFQAIWNEFSAFGLCELIFACKDGKNLSGLLLLKYKQRVSAEWAASDETYKQLSPNQFLFWEAIKDARSKGFAIFDFGRTSPSNSGLMNFKNRWGAAVSDLHEMHFPVGKCKIENQNGHSLVERMISNICRRTPAVLLEPIGKFIYNHIG